MLSETMCHKCKELQPCPSLIYSIVIKNIISAKGDPFTLPIKKKKRYFISIFQRNYALAE